MTWRFAMPYQKVVLSDGTEVLFGMPEEPEATGTHDADTQQKGTTRLSPPPHREEPEKSLVK
jgi:hypothetical protein